MNENTSIDSFFFCIDLFVSLFFSFVCIFIFEGISDKLDALGNHWWLLQHIFLLKYNWKKKTLKVFFGVPDFGQPNAYIDLPNDLNISLISKEMINFIIICRVILLVLALLFENCSLTKAHKITYSLLFKLI